MQALFISLSYGRIGFRRLSIAFALVALDSFCQCFELRAHQLRQKEIERSSAHEDGEYDSSAGLQIFMKSDMSIHKNPDVPDALDGEKWFLRRSRIYPNLVDYQPEVVNDPSFAPSGGKKLVDGIAGIGEIGALPNGVDAADIVGIRSNQAGDLAAFVAALVGNGLFLIIIFIGFTFYLRRTYPAIYQNNADEGILDKLPHEKRLTKSICSWFLVSWRITSDEVADHIGLDSAMLLEFTHMGMKVFGILSVPLLLVMGPLDALYGGHAAGDDTLSIPTMNNIEPGSWLYWIYPFIVWGVTIVVTEFIFNAKKQFITRRHKWLRHMQLPRAATIMVEGIPKEYRTDQKLKAYFERMFGHAKVKEAFVVKRLPELEVALARRAEATKGLLSAGFRLEKFTDIEEIRSTIMMEEKDYDRDRTEAQRDIDKEWLRAQDQFETPAGINTGTGFVTFTDRRIREIALLLEYNEHARQWKASVPPAPESVIWRTFKMPVIFKETWALVGWFLLILLGIFYLPIVLYIGIGAASIKLGWLEPVWIAFAPSAGLTIMVSLLPWCFGFIARKFFPLKDEGQFQDVVQRWGFIFQTCFVILVPAIGSSLTSFIERVARSPLSVFSILSSTMPNSTHFYMNYLVLQMTFQVLNLWRYMNLGRYFTFRTLFPPKEAKKYSEPEDQDYCGIGNRCANFVLFFNIGIVFGTLCPFILVEALVMFALCRLTFGYLVTYAETIKPDVGGHFWEKQMSHLLVGLGIYCILMSGVFLQYAPNVICGLISLPTIIYVCWSYYCYQHDYNWKSLPWEKLVNYQADDLVDDSLLAERDHQINYEQPEIRETRLETTSQRNLSFGCAKSQDTHNSSSLFEDFTEQIDAEQSGKLSLSHSSSAV